MRYKHTKVSHVRSDQHFQFGNWRAFVSKASREKNDVTICISKLFFLHFYVSFDDFPLAGGWGVGVWRLGLPGSQKYMPFIEISWFGLLLLLLFFYVQMEWGMGKFGLAVLFCGGTNQ
jgi:hypothetical protein